MISSKTLTNKKVVFTLALFGCFLWGSAFPAIKTGYELFHIGSDDLPGKLLFAGYRFTLAGGILLVFSLISGKKIFALDLSDYLRLILLGLMMTTMQYTFFYVGLSHTSGVKGSIINGVTTFFYVILAHFAFAGERLTRNTILGCLIGFAGVISINLGRASSPSGGFTLTGEGFLIIAALTQATAGLYGKVLSRNMDPVIMTGWQLGLGGAVLTIMGFAMGGSLSGFTVTSTSLLIYMGLLSSVAFAILAVLLKYNPVSTVTVFQFTTPVFGATLSALFLGDRLLEWKNLAALVCVSVGIYLVTAKSGAKTATAEK